MSLSWLLVLACKDKSPVVEDTASSEWTWSQVAWRPMAAVPGGSMDFVVMGDGDPATVLAASNNNGLFVATTDDALFTKSNDPELAPHFYANLAFNADGTEIWATLPLGPVWRGVLVAD